MNDYDIEKMFIDEIREKKKVARGIYNRASRLGNVGAVKTQVDFLKGKEKKYYMGNGDVKVSNMYIDIDKVPVLSEIDEMDYDVAQKLVTELKKMHTIVKLKVRWGCKSASGVYSVFYKYKIMDRPPSSSSGARLEKKLRLAKEKKDKLTNKNDVEKVDNEKVEDEKVEVEKVVEPLKNDIKEGFRISFKGDYDKEYIDKKITAIIMTMEDDKTYKLNFDFVEL